MRADSKSNLPTLGPNDIILERMDDLVEEVEFLVLETDLARLLGVICGFPPVPLSTSFFVFLSASDASEDKSFFDDNDPFLPPLRARD